jgi:S1-C subfamily serine protease
MPSITSAPTSPTSPSLIAGEPLLNAEGSVLGILYDPEPGTSPATFLPSELVVGVANDLRSQNRVVHGWLGVQGTDAPDGGGATVAQVQSGGPADGRLQVGQLITAVNATPVRTMAEVRALLYVLPPGTAITLSVQQPTGTKVVDVTLGTSS